MKLAGQGKPYWDVMWVQELEASQPLKLGYRFLDLMPNLEGCCLEGHVVDSGEIAGQGERMRSLL